MNWDQYKHIMEQFGRKMQKLETEISFRIMQMQFDAQEGRTAQAKEAKELAKAAFAECLDIVLEHAQEVAKGGPEMPLSIADILGGGGTLN